MGTFGGGVFENDAARDWLGFLERGQMIAVAAALNGIPNAIAELGHIPAETEQKFWAMCEVVALLGEWRRGGEVPQEIVATLELAKGALGIPNLAERLAFAFERLADAETELDRLWKGDEEWAAILDQRELIKARALSAAA